MRKFSYIVWNFHLNWLTFLEANTMFWGALLSGLSVLSLWVAELIAYWLMTMVNVWMEVQIVLLLAYIRQENLQSMSQQNLKIHLFVTDFHIIT